MLYLLPDLAAHARDIRAALRPGGSYVAAMGCHTGFQRVAALAQADRRDLVDPALRPFARGRSKAFAEAGFTVSVRPLALDAFMQVTIGSAYFPKVIDQLRYYTTDKVLFRFVRQP